MINVLFMWSVQLSDIFRNWIEKHLISLSDSSYFYYYFTFDKKEKRKEKQGKKFQG